MGKQNKIETYSETAVQESDAEISHPPKYKVIILNDDYTPMDYVVEILCHFFAMDEQRATKVMLEVHHTGKGICGIYPGDIAETKVAQVNEHARQSEYPLLCIMEQE